MKELTSKEKYSCSLGKNMNVIYVDTESMEDKQGWESGISHVAGIEGETGILEGEGKVFGSEGLRGEAQRSQNTSTFHHPKTHRSSW